MQQVATSFVIPSVTCSASNSSVSFAVEVSDSSSGKWVRIEFDVDWRAGKAIYRCMYKESGERRAKLSGRVEPADAVSIDLTGSRRGISADVEDQTQGWSTGIDGRDRLSPDGGGVVVSERRSPDAIRPLADFSSIRFTDTKVGFKPISGQVSRVAIRSGGTVKATATALHRRTGTFSVNWQHE